ncbi:MAG: hypothetical protein WC661_06435 [Opitutaceae bacterium]|jgi:hypothetical protein
MRVSVSRTLVWAMTLAVAILLLTALFLDTARKPPAPTAKEDAWLEFVGSDLATFVFDEAPALSIPLELIRLVPPDDEDHFFELTTGQETEAPVLLPAADPLRWLDGHAPPLRSSVGPNHLQYKFDPDFGLENRALRMNGMMIRLRVEF